MRLSQFITSNLEPILAEFEEFARTHTSAGEAMDMRALRDHAAAMLKTITLDIEEPQSDSAQKQKSEGDGPATEELAPTAAEKHGSDRADSGFTLAEMFAEYRALRATVLRLWTENCGRLEEDDLQDLIRFNEAIDQSLAESISKYSTGIESSREMFLGILGHDLRSPLGAVLSATEFLIGEGDLRDQNLKMALIVQRSGRRMLALVSDLLDFTMTRLGTGIPVTRVDTDLAAIAVEAVEEARTHHPTRQFELKKSGDLGGRWDSKRVSQALTNLVGNAAQHGAEDLPIEILVRGEADEVVIAVHNWGAAIPPEDRQKIFNPFKKLHLGEAVDHEQQGSIGLGLFIAEQIAIAHEGSIGVESSEEAGTTFELHLPRLAAPLDEVPAAAPGENKTA